MTKADYCYLVAAYLRHRIVVKILGSGIRLFGFKSLPWFTKLCDLKEVI